MEMQDQSKKDNSEKIAENDLHDVVKDNYSKRIEEVDHFTKRLMNAYGEACTEFLYGSLNIAQHFLDMQQKYSSVFPFWYSTDLLQNMIKQNTKAWSQVIQNADSIYVESWKNVKNNLRASNKNSILFIQSLDSVCDLGKNIQTNKKNYLN